MMASKLLSDERFEQLDPDSFPLHSPVGCPDQRSTKELQRSGRDCLSPTNLDDGEQTAQQGKL